MSYCIWRVVNRTTRRSCLARAVSDDGTRHFHFRGADLFVTPSSFMAHAQRPFSMHVRRAMNGRDTVRANAPIVRHCVSMETRLHIRTIRYI
jgi:hypothetical protein